MSGVRIPRNQLHTRHKAHHELAGDPELAQDLLHGLVRLVRDHGDVDQQEVGGQLLELWRSGRREEESSEANRT